MVRVVSSLKINHLRVPAEKCDGHSGESFQDQGIASDPKGTDAQGGAQLPTPADASRLDWKSGATLYEERAAHRQFDGDCPRVEAELLAWREIEWRWHFAHRDRSRRGLCRDGGQLIERPRLSDLIDGARVT